MARSEATDQRQRELTPSHLEEKSGGANYTELMPIGSGGSADISIALSRSIGGFSKVVVLKTIRKELVEQRGAAKMFLDEARLSARMNHPNVVQVYEVFMRRKVPVIVMEFLDGQPLSVILGSAIESGHLTLQLTISILTKVLAGLHYAHTLRDFSGEPLGLIHRDVSPHNVMVTYDGQVKLVDFGIAKLSKSEHQTRTGVVKGKITYMAPEQLTGHADCRSDIFAVGVMLWEMATRERFWGDIPEAALLGRLISGDLPRLDRTTDVDEDLLKICRRALSADAADRYATAAEMQSELERYLMQRGTLVSQSDIGQLVIDCCSDARESVQGEIQRHLSALGLSLTGNGDARPSEHGGAAPSARPSRRSWIWLGAVSVGAVGIALALWEKPEAQPAAALVAPAPVVVAPSLTPPLPPPAPEPSPAPVRVRATALPSSAIWYLDDQKLANPIDYSSPRDDRPHVLRAEAEGYELFTKVVRFDSDVDITVTLGKKEVEAAAPPAPPRRAPAPARVTYRRPAPEPVALAPSDPLPPPLPPPPAPKEEREKEASAVQFGESLKPEGLTRRPMRGIEGNYPGQ